LRAELSTVNTAAQLYPKGEAGMGDIARARARATSPARVPARVRSRSQQLVATFLTGVFAVVAAVVVLAAVSNRLSDSPSPSVFGHPAFAVLSGSMAPAIRTGDLVFADSLSATERRELRPGQVVTFRSAGDGSRLFTHRIVGVRHGAGDAVAYVTKGDANDSPDTTAVPADHVLGLYRTRIPYGGYLLSWLHRPAAVATVAAALALLLFGIKQLRSGGGLPRPQLPRRPGRSKGVRRDTRVRLARVVRKAHPRRPHRRRPLAIGGIAVLPASGTLVGTTLGLFTSTPGAAANTFTAGTVVLTGNATGACNVTGLMPGDAPPACTFVATYTGTASAYLGLDVLIQTQAGAGGGPLYNPPASNNALTVAITDNQGTPVTYTVPTVSTACPVGAPALSTCYALANQLVRATPFSATTAVTFSTAVSLPLAAGNTTQAAAAQVILTAHAVQSKNQTLPPGCTPGAVCAPTGTFSWS
jgi:signal peptidase